MTGDNISKSKNISLNYIADYQYDYSYYNYDTEYNLDINYKYVNFCHIIEQLDILDSQKKISHESVKKKACNFERLKKKNEKYYSFLDLESKLNNLYDNDISSFLYENKISLDDTHRLPKIRLSKKYVELGCLGVWKLSSFKNKFNVKNLRDIDPNTYWQTDSLAPHTITIQFIKFLKISKIYLLLNYYLDESYTPHDITIHIGNDENHLELLCETFCDMNKYSLNEPFWFLIDFEKCNMSSYYYNYNINHLKKKNHIYCRCLKISVISSQHNGKDTRIRQLQIYGPNYFHYKYDKMLI